MRGKQGIPCLKIKDAALVVCLGIYGDGAEIKAILDGFTEPSFTLFDWLT